MTDISAHDWTPSGVRAEPVGIVATPTIRVLVEPADLRACQEVQRRSFGISEDGYVIPVATMALAARAGGLVLGAYVDEALAGFSFAFFGRMAGRAVLVSQVTAVDPRFQRRGIGRHIKGAQRAHARTLDVASVVWTFDPLRASNAHFNLNVVGARCRTYVPNLYGGRTDALSAGLETDRLFAEWETGEVPVNLTTRWGDGIELIEPIVDSAVRPVPRLSIEIPEGAAHVHVAIPPDLDALRADVTLVRDWQLAVRGALTCALGRGFVVVGFTREPAPAYLLARDA